ncbi:Ku protein [Rhodoligotrophos defluvii]|uniref:non-homologous end joining protein Ku n=1 Tax=Rhodoligotrophos defluvii TaxID=2561934 RepID=UPI0010C9EC25|nr:Ku protein [Rhodoligotrophos defluvii]
MAPRANWKGYLQIGEVVCPVALYTAASTSERVSFHTINRKTGNRVRRQYIDESTGKPVETEDQVRGYEVSKNDYIVLTPDEIASAVPESNKTLAVEAFVPCSEVDEVYFDRPYYLAPTGRAAEEAFAVIVAGLEAKKVAALARTVLFRRLRTVLIRAHGPGLIANTLNFDYEVRSAENAFSEIPDVKITKDMLELARHIIDTKSGHFDPKTFDDRYDAALAELVKAKIEGKPLPKAKPREAAKVVDLMEALRQSAGLAGGKAQAAGSKPRSRAGKTRAAEKPAARRKAS